MRFNTFQVFLPPNELFLKVPVSQCQRVLGPEKYRPEGEHALDQVPQLCEGSRESEVPFRCGDFGDVTEGGCAIIGSKEIGLSILLALEFNGAFIQGPYREEV